MTISPMCFNFSMTHTIILIILIVNPKIGECSIKTDLFEKVVSCLNISVANNVTYQLRNNGKIFCASMCLHDKECKSYSVHEEAKMCYLNGNLLDNTGCVDGFVHFNSKKAINEPDCLNDGVYNSVSDTCQCVNSYIGDRCERLMQDCNEGFHSGHYTGMKDVFTIHPTQATNPFQVYCEMEWEGELFLLKRGPDGPFVNFTRGWSDYKDGIGDIRDKNFWLGLEKAHLITSSREYLLVVEGFMNEAPPVKSALDGYRFMFSYDYSNTNHEGGIHILDDCLGPLQGQPFSAMDSDNDASTGNCAETYGSGWWFNNCSVCNPTGVVQPTSDTVVSQDPTFMSWPVPGDLPARYLSMFLKYHVG